MNKFIFDYLNKSKQLNQIWLLFVSRSQLHSSCTLNAGKLWRQKNNLPKLQTARGPLIDLPDYSFCDGRPTPLSVGQARRQELQKTLAMEAVQGLNFLKRAKQLATNDVK